MTKLDAGLITSLPASDPGSAAVWGSKRINPRPQSCLCLTWSGYPSNDDDDDEPPKTRKKFVKIITFQALTANYLSEFFGQQQRIIRAKSDFFLAPTMSFFLLRRRLKRYPLLVRHKQDWGRGFILLLPQAAVLPESDAGSDLGSTAAWDVQYSSTADNELFKKDK